MIPVGDGSPVTIDVGDNVTAPSNTTITIRCPVSGIPKPVISWERDGVQVTLEGRLSISSDNSLVIKEAGVDESANYKCSVRSIAGTDSVSSTVSIVGQFHFSVVFSTTMIWCLKSLNTTLEKKISKILFVLMSSLFKFVY